MTTVCDRCGLPKPSSSIALCPRCLLLGDEQDLLPSAPAGIVLETEIGRGGMGRVFRAHQVGLDRTVAIKFLPPELSTDPAFEARFAREARALASLSHPHIVAVHDFGTNADGDTYLVMEFISGGTLARRLPLSPEDAARTMQEICAGLAYAHLKGVVHRDVKPDNILFDERDRAKLADFGIARVMASVESITQPLEVLGTPGYLAPEARSGAAPDPRMDVYSAGVLFRTMLTGRSPEEDAGGIPPAFAPIVRRATADRPSDRFARISDLGRAIDEAARGSADIEPGAAPGDVLPADEQSWIRAVALTLTGATSLSLYAFLLSLSPRVLEMGSTLPFVVFGAEELPGGRLYTRARFETFPTLVAAGGWAVAFAAYGLLRRHWRHSGLDAPAPERPLPNLRALLIMAAVLNALFVGRLVSQELGATTVGNYMPVAGGVLELVMLFMVWTAALEAARTARSLAREPRLWIGLGLSLVPPGIAFLRMLAGRSP